MSPLIVGIKGSLDIVAFYTQSDPESGPVPGKEAEMDEDRATCAPPGRSVSEPITEDLPGHLYGRATQLTSPCLDPATQLSHKNMFQGSQDK